jgi:alanine dehydrogenase
MTLIIGNDDVAKLLTAEITMAARPDFNAGFQQKKVGKRAHGVALADKVVYFEDIIKGTNRGRSSGDQITYSERGNLQGAQFFAVAGRVYELAKAAGLGREIPTEWLLQDIRD